MEWIRILQYYCDAVNLESTKAEFQAKIAGTKLNFTKR